VKLPVEGAFLKQVVPFSSKMAEEEYTKYMLLSNVKYYDTFYRKDLPLELYVDAEEINYRSSLLKNKCSFSLMNLLSLELELPGCESVNATIKRNEKYYTGSYFGLNIGFPNVSFKTGDVEVCLTDPETLEQLGPGGKKLGKAINFPEFSLDYKTTSNGSFFLAGSYAKKKEMSSSAKKKKGSKANPKKSAGKKADNSFLNRFLPGWKIKDCEFLMCIGKPPMNVFLEDIGKQDFFGHVGATIGADLGPLTLDISGKFGVFYAIPYEDSLGFNLDGSLSVSVWIISLNNIADFEGSFDIGHRVYYLQTSAGIDVGLFAVRAKLRFDVDDSKEAMSFLRPALQAGAAVMIQTPLGGVEGSLKIKCFANRKIFVNLCGLEWQVASNNMRFASKGESLLASTSQLPLGEPDARTWDAPLTLNGFSWTGYFTIGSATENGIKMAVLKTSTGAINVEGRQNSDSVKISNFAVPEDAGGRGNFFPGTGLVEGAAMKGDISVEFQAQNGSMYRVEQNDVILRMRPDGVISIDPDQKKVGGCGLEYGKDKDGRHTGLKALIAKKMEKQKSSDPESLEINALNINLYDGRKCSIGVCYNQNAKERYTLIHTILNP
jgi:hypothetical protein